MGIFGTSKQFEQRKFVERAEAIAGSFQLELYSSCERASLARLPADLAGKVAAALANYVCRFGHVNPEHATNPELMRLVENEKSKVLFTLSDIFKTNATGVLIILGAAWQIDIARFREHMANLANLKFVQFGGNTPDVRAELPQNAQKYFLEVVALRR